MNKEQKTWISTLEALIQEKNMLSHPFYQAWTCGHLEQSTLMEYAKAYYHHVKAFPTYLSAIHTRSEDMKTRKHLLNNLVDEEGGNPNHPDLWASFARALGVTQESLDQNNPSLPEKELVDTFNQICREEPIAAGIAALYCYESQIPAICASKIEGLKKWYHMENPESYRYFTVHETADVEHSRVEKLLLETLVQTKETEMAVLASAEKILGALWKFLSSFKLNNDTELNSKIAV